LTDAPRSPLRRKLRAQIADSILDAAEQVALESGVGGMTIAAVAARAGVAVGTLYNYYPDGEGILTALFRARRATLMPLIAAAVAGTKALPFETRLRELVRRLLVAFESHARFVQLAVLVDRDTSRCKPRDATLRDATIAALEQVMREGAHRRLFAAREARTYARMMHGALRSLFLWRVSPSEPISAEGEQLVEMFLRGLMPR
jgi:AcrR family transcriptional regulator